MPLCRVWPLATNKTKEIQYVYNPEGNKTENRKRTRSEATYLWDPLYASLPLGVTAQPLCQTMYIVTKCHHDREAASCSSLLFVKAASLNWASRLVRTMMSTT